MRLKSSVSYCVGIHNEAKILKKNLEQIDKYLQGALGKKNFEILVVDNASIDDSEKIVRKLHNPRVVYFYTKTKGFGAAFKIALEKAHFERIVFTAIDLPFGFSDFENAYPLLDQCDVVFGSKAHPDSITKRDTLRHLTSYIYQFLLSTFFHNNVQDTQGSIFLKKGKIEKIKDCIHANNAFFSTELALYAQREHLKVKEVAVVLQKDPKDRVSRYKIFSDGIKMFTQIVRELFCFYGGRNLLIRSCGLLFVTVFLSFASFGIPKGLYLYFWRDDWTAFWFLKNNLSFYFNSWILPSRHPGEFLDTFPWIYVFSLNSVSWQIMGVLLKTIASLGAGLISYTAFKNKKIAILSCLLFASYFGGLEGFTWISARLSAYLIVLYAITLFLFVRVVSTRRFYFITAVCLFISLLLEPGRSVFFLVLIALFAIAKRGFPKKLIPLFCVTIPIGLLSTAYGRTMLGFKSKELVSPYAVGVLNRALSLESMRSYFASLSGLVTGQILLISHPNKMFLVSITVFSVLTLYAFYLFLKKQDGWIQILFFMLWIIVFFSAGWISDPGNFIPVDSRYFTLSAVGVVALSSYFISKLSNWLLLLIYISLLIFNLSQSKLIIEQEYQMRGISVSKPLLQLQEKQVSQNFSHGIFIVTGSNALRGYVFDWSYGGGLPFALSRGISNPLSVPVLASKEEAEKMLCGEIAVRYYLDNYLKLEPNKLTLSDIYAWKVTDEGHLIDQTETIRKQIVTDSDCLR